MNIGKPGNEIVNDLIIKRIEMINTTKQQRIETMNPIKKAILLASEMKQWKEFEKRYGKKEGGIKY
jgi:hypothetical protein